MFKFSPWWPQSRVLTPCAACSVRRGTDFPFWWDCDFWKQSEALGHNLVLWSLSRESLAQQPDQRTQGMLAFPRTAVRSAWWGLSFHISSHKRQKQFLISSGFSHLSEGSLVPCLSSCFPFLYLSIFYNVFPRRKAGGGGGGLGAGLGSHLLCERK